MSTVAEASLDMSGLFEAEVLTILLLRRWNHPHKDDRAFADDLLENAANALRQAVAGEKLIESLPVGETNLIAAIYFVEWIALTNGAPDPKKKRSQWLKKMRQSLPSCFCAQEDLPPG